MAILQIEGFKEPGYGHADAMALAEQAAAGALVPTLTTLLSPFEPLAWDRRRVPKLFGFDYRTECYPLAPLQLFHVAYLVVRRTDWAA